MIKDFETVQKLTDEGKKNQLKSQASNFTNILQFYVFHKILSFRCWDKLYHPEFGRFRFSKIKAAVKPSLQLLYRIIPLYL